MTSKTSFSDTHPVYGKTNLGLCWDFVTAAQPCLFCPLTGVIHRQGQLFKFFLHGLNLSLNLFWSRRSSVISGLDQSRRILKLGNIFWQPSKS